MKAHIARNQNAGVPLALVWNLAPGDRGKLDGMAPAFGMKIVPVAPADAGQTVAQLLGEAEVLAPHTLQLEPGAYPPAIVLANFRPRDAATLFDLLNEAKADIPLRAEATQQMRGWVFGDVLAYIQEQRAAKAAGSAGV